MSALPTSFWPWLTLACSLASFGLCCVNLLWYRAPRLPERDGPVPQVSVLIPARNEELSIMTAVESVLASRGVELELLVLDDASTDRTAELVNALAARDSRVRLHSAPALPSGWNGKQHACAVLAGLAGCSTLCFLDADVRLAPDALVALVGEQRRRHVDLLSGFPLEETGTWLEKLLLPFIHFVLLCYLPLPFSRAFPRRVGFAAGCGQVMLVRRDAYQASGGHAAIRETMHDGMLLPVLFRKHGFATALCDLTNLARCRMYHNAREVWSGLGKNATEGMAAPARILPFSVLLLFGQVVPVVWVCFAAVQGAPLFWSLLSAASGYVIRILLVWRFRQSFLSALLHPAGVLMLLFLQWWALGRKLTGRRAVWKQRAYEIG